MGGPDDDGCRCGIRLLCDVVRLGCRGHGRRVRRLPAVHARRQARRRGRTDDGRRSRAAALDRVPAHVQCRDHERARRRGRRHGAVRADGGPRDGCHGHGDRRDGGRGGLLAAGRHGGLRRVRRARHGRVVRARRERLRGGRTLLRARVRLERRARRRGAALRGVHARRAQLRGDPRRNRHPGLRCVAVVERRVRGRRRRRRASSARSRPAGSWQCRRGTCRRDGAPGCSTPRVRSSWWRRARRAETHGCCTAR